MNIPSGPTVGTTSLVWPQQQPYTILSEIDDRNPNASDFNLMVVQYPHKPELEAARGRMRTVETNNADRDTNREIASNHTLEQALSRTTDFGANFLKTQVNKKREINEPCGVVVHDYGAQHYYLNGAPFVKSVPSKSLERENPFQNSRTLVEAIPGIFNDKPEWACVR